MKLSDINFLSSFDAFVELMHLTPRRGPLVVTPLATDEEGRRKALREGLPPISSVRPIDTSNIISGRASDIRPLSPEEEAQLDEAVQRATTPEDDQRLEKEKAEHFIRQDQVSTPSRIL